MPAMHRCHWRNEIIPVGLALAQLHPGYMGWIRRTDRFSRTSGSLAPFPRLFFAKRPVLNKFLNPIQKRSRSQSCIHEKCLVSSGIFPSNFHSEQIAMRIAIIGSGISGAALAHFLNREFDSEKLSLTIFESREYAGGHTRTVEIEDAGNTIGIDMGFIVFNERNLSEFLRIAEGTEG